LVPALSDRGVGLVAISPQKPDGSLSAAEKNELTFTVLSDPGNQIAQRLGVTTAPTDDAQAAQRAIGFDLPDANADGSNGLPMPTVVIVDESGVIRWIDVHPNYTTRTEVNDILAALQTLP
jgi:peroxiredoxin